MLGRGALRVPTWWSGACAPGHARGCLASPEVPKSSPPPFAQQLQDSPERSTDTMADEELNLYDEIEIEDCFYDETLQIYHHPCPCGDRFEISIFDMRDGEDIARCPSCSLMIRIIFDAVCACNYVFSFPASHHCLMRYLV